MSIEDIMFLLIIGTFSFAIIFVPFFFVFSCYKERTYLKTRGPKQHLMFNQLKKGDIIWKLYDGQLISYIVKNVEYLFSSTGKIRRVIIVIDDYNVIRLDENEAKSFKYMDYYTLYSEVNFAHKLINAKREKELQKFTSVSAAKIQKEADEAIKRIENLKKSL